MFLAILITLIVVALLVGVAMQRWVRQRRILAELTAKLEQQEASLREAQRRDRLLFSSNPLPMWIYDRETLHFVEVNEAALGSYGYSREEFLAMTLMDIRPEEDAPAFLELIQQDTDAYARPGVWRHRRKDGEIVFVQVMGSSFHSGGRPLRMVAAIDITERRRMEDALRESEATLKALVDNAPFGIARASLDQDRCLKANPALLGILGGYTEKDVLALNISQHVYAEPKERGRLLQLLRRSGVIKGWETNLKRRNGTLVPVRLTLTLSNGHNGEPQALSTYVEDLTQQSVLEQQVRQVQKLEAVGRLAGGMAHDFNNILLVIKLSTDLMLSQVMPDSPFSKSLLQISNAADRAAGLTKQMLAFGRQQIMQPRIINLNTVVAETTHMLRRVIGEDIDLVTNLGKNVENSRLDPDQMTQVILNLAVNARDAMPQGGMLHLETATVLLDQHYARDHAPVLPGRYVMLAVSDTGSGIDRSILPRIFDPFFTTKEVGKGTGLGLSIVYGIVKQSGGYIWVYSEPGHGTTFKLYFPATSASVEASAAPSEDSVHPAGQRILLVEDDATIRNNVCDCLKQLGYQVVPAENAAMAIKRCTEADGKIDLLLTDLVMAGQSGQELANQLVDSYPNLRVLFMSGYTEDGAARREMLLKGSSFLPKPFSVADLASAVRDALVLKLTLM